MIYAYSFTLCRRAVIITMDTSASNLRLLETDPWLSNPKNVQVVSFTAPAWDGGAELPPVHDSPRHEVMAAWPVREVVAFLVARDLEGPASVFHGNGVNGADLLTMTTESMVHDLRLSPFAARKVATARDTYLEES